MDSPAVNQATLIHRNRLVNQIDTLLSSTAIVDKFGGASVPSDFVPSLKATIEVVGTTSTYTFSYNGVDFFTLTETYVDDFNTTTLLAVIP